MITLSEVQAGVDSRSVRTGIAEGRQGQQRSWLGSSRGASQPFRILVPPPPRDDFQTHKEIYVRRKQSSPVSNLEKVLELELPRGTYKSWLKYYTTKLDRYCIYHVIKLFIFSHGLCTNFNSCVLIATW